MKLTLHVWRQPGPDAEGRFETYQVPDVDEHMSFLEMLDVVNERLIEEGKEPIAFEHDCREGICGACGCLINGRPHGRTRLSATCQLHMRHFKDGEELTIEPMRAKGFPVLRDLIVDRSALDRIVQAGGYISARTGSVPDANVILVPKLDADWSMDAAACIGCGACVAACPNASAMLFVAAKVSHLGLLPQGQPERYERVQRMLAQADAEGFGYCSNHGACTEVCPKNISLDFIAKLNRDLMSASLRSRVQED
ncbi:MAG TPA: succinate dehydrogenase/fumarate reductase iron-sulfur subunit [Armatimonadetes bacterium]|mgnify:FL=1|nr:succinate dehydrogenase/fumarate reductase iron-sulfur subunit [Armatimonadota bacterium]